MNTTDLMGLMALLSGWSAIIGGIVAIIKRLVNVHAPDLTTAGRVVVLLLPVLPILLGIGTGMAGAFELCLRLAGFAPPETWGVDLALLGAFAGAGAGSVSGQTIKVYKQTLQQRDHRLDGGADA